jgi:glutathione S-transferase
MRFGESQVGDSHAILRFLDSVCTGPKFLPDGRDDVVAFDRWLGDVFNKYVVYFNWVDRRGFDRSVAPTISRVIPAILRCCVSPWRVTSSVRRRMLPVINATLPADVTRDRDTMQAGMIAELRKMDARFVSDSQRFLFSDVDPTAPDFALFGIMQHIVDFSGDSGLRPFLPELWELAPMPRLRAWYERMRVAYPIDFRSRRVRELGDFRLDLTRDHTMADAPVVFKPVPTQ